MPCWRRCMLCLFSFQHKVRKGVFPNTVTMSSIAFMDHLNDIDVEDLQYVETDLCFYQLVSLGLLLYGDDQTRRQFMLQKLIILSQHPPQGKFLKELDQLGRSDILSNYAKLNPHSWRSPVIEALAIIKAKRVVRKLGLRWQEIYQHFLPHVAEISVHIHPLLKALYIICESLTPHQAGKLINSIKTKYNVDEDLRFYDISYLEVFIINWLNKRLIKLGDKQLKGCDMQILIEYFKFNDLDSIKNLVVETINQNSKDDKDVDENVVCDVLNNSKDSGVCMSQEVASNTHSADSKAPNVRQPQPKLSDDCDTCDRYAVSKKSAGYVLIINQNKFYKESDPKFLHIFPTLRGVTDKREGTNVDRDNLKKLFSSFGYIPLVFNNLTHLQIMHQIRETVKKSVLKDSLIICILSHGIEGAVFGCNGLPVAITDIKEILTADILKGKPKMLIIQACQRNESGSYMKNYTSITDFSPDAYADQLLAMSSIPGTDALRHVEHGSWFVDSLCKYTYKYGDRKHMLDILTAVIRDISERRGDANQVMLPYTISTMRKEFYLP